MTTIYAPITSINQNGVCVIRISGDDTINCLLKLGINVANIKNRVSSLHNIIIDNQLIDNSLVTYFKAPNSYTGEDVAEISIHASSFIFNEISTKLSSISNVRLAEAGEFSKRSFINNKIDLIKAESIVDLIASETKIQHQQAIRQYSGKVSNIYQEIRNNIISALSKIEAAIDFPEDDIPNTVTKDITNIVKNIITKMNNIINDDNIGLKIKKGLQVIIMGQPNVGKSTLINFLSNDNISITSDISGTTRDIISSYININGIPVNVYDTAGIRQSGNKIEVEGIKRAIAKSINSDLKIIVIDPSKKLTNDIFDIIDYDSLIIINKIDCCSDQDINDKIKILSKYTANITKISLIQEINVSNIKSIIANLLKSKFTNINSSIITSQRHKTCLIKSIEHLNNFNLNKNIEIAAEDLRLAAHELSVVTGSINIDNILDEIFSKFCIGK